MDDGEDDDDAAILVLWLAQAEVRGGLSYMFARARDLALAVLTPSGLDASAYHPVARLGVHESDEVSTCSPTATL